MNDFLFTVPEHLSPRLKWIREHKLITFHSLPGTEDALWFAGFNWENIKYEREIDFFVTRQFKEIGEGKTQDEAIENLCRKRGVKLWNEI